MAIPGALTHGLPPLPDNETAPREISDIVPNTILGFDNWDNSGLPFAQINGNDMDLTSDSGNLGWVMYRHSVTPMETSLDRVEISMNTSPEGAYVAVSDYGANAWSWRGPFTGSANISLNPGNFLNNGHFYVVVAVFGGASTSVHSSWLYYDNQVAAPPTYLDDVRPFLADNCFSCHGVDSQVAGVELESYNGAFTSAAMTKDKVNADHKGSWDQADKDIVAAWANAGAPLGDAVTYTNDLLPGVLSPICMQCHDSSLAGGARSGAPPSINFDTFANVTNPENLPKSANNRAQAGTMPPGGSGLSLTPQQQQMFQDWIDAGWPE